MDRVLQISQSGRRQNSLSHECHSFQPRFTAVILNLRLPIIGLCIAARDLKAPNVAEYAQKKLGRARICYQLMTTHLLIVCAHVEGLVHAA